MLYTQEYMQELSRHILSTIPAESPVSVCVIELLGLDKVTEEQGPAAASEVMLTFSRLCRIAIEGDIVAGKLDDNRIAVLFTDAGSAEAEHERVTNTIAMLKELLAQAQPEAAINLIGGFAVEKAGKTGYDALKRMALVACRSASRTLGESAVGYADTGIEAADAKITTGLSERYRALELRFQQQVNLLRSIESDPLTGLLGRQAFYRRVRELLDLDTDERYAIVRFDINRFKVYNDVRGTEAGDRLLRDIGEQLKLHAGSAELIARLESDHFALLMADNQDTIDKSQAMLSKMIATLTPGFRLTGTVGVYSIEDPDIDVSLMCDRALLALRSVKSGFETRIAYYDKTLRDHLLEEQDLMDDMETALESGQFELYFQPQVNYEGGTLVGAEALVRWRHPTRGLLSPGVFIPLFEKNGLITRLDEYVWDKCCYYIRRWTDAYPESASLSISVNVSRLDINDPYLCNKLRNIVQKHGLTPSALHLEITESAYMESPQRLIDAVRRLKVFGFTVEMDDFGSGFSSLNTLKDVIVDVLKLDMKFLSSSDDSSRGGSILGSVIRMAHWLKLPVIAEGVETREQADYLKSLGCLYMQGYYFDAPMPAASFEKLLSASEFGKTDRYTDVNLEGVAAFWDSSAQTTLLFNSYVGGAAIIEYANRDVSIVRANDRFYSEIGTTLEDYVDKQQNTVNRFDEKNAAIYIAMVEEAISTGDEAECELQSLPHKLGERPLWTHLRARPLAKNGGVWLLYLAVENITERKLLEEERDAENERSRLLLQSTRTALLDYDVASDALSYQTYLPESGIVNRTVKQYYNHLLTSSAISSASVAAIRAIISSVSSGPVNGEFECLANLWGTGMRWCRVNYVGVEDSGGQVYRIVGQAVDINEKKERDELEAAVSQRLNTKSYAHTYSDIIVNQIYGLFYDSTDIERAIETTLALLGEYYELSRAYIFEDSDDHSCASNTFEWHAEGITPERSRLQDISYDDMGGRDYYISRFDETGTFYCHDLRELGDEAREVLEPQGIGSMLQYAILDSGVFSGMVGFDECREGRVWSDEMTGTLMFVSRIIGSFLIKLRQSDSAAFSADFRAALDNNSAFIYIIDPETYEVIYTNKAIQEKDGADHIGKICYKKFMGLSAPCEQCPIQMLHERGTHVAEVLRPDGMLLLAQASPLRWNGRDMVMLSCTDISESKKAERALAEAEDANSAKSEFLSKISHDMRTPLNAVIGLANMALEKPGIPDEVAEYLAMIDRSSRSLQTLLNDILDMSKIEKRIAELNPERYEYGEFLDTLKAVFLPICEQKQITFTIEDDAPHCALLADRARLNQIFFNLLSNAVRYTDAGGEIKLISRGRPVYDVVSFDFVVSDTGCGMSQDFLSRVFEPFAQENPSVERDDGGSGLGVPLAKSYVDMMGGTIEIKSELGAGTEVSIHLDLPIDGSALTLEAREAAPADKSLAGRQIILAEDIPINTAIIKNTLERAGATVFCAENGRVALELFSSFEQDAVDAIVMDIFMPVMDGLESARCIRGLSRRDASRLPIVALSANAFEHDRELSIQAGMNAHLSKPVDGELLVSTLAQLIAPKR